ncbi:putative Reverse transcriptase (RNA dependent DNA polymerase) [Trypanosoma vivax]|nr:putative Reverse transcriptase (RNA dependent DNA polymerase) [Trypanosoma vivax]
MSGVNPDVGHYCIVFGALSGASLLVIAPSKKVRVLDAWERMKRHEFRKPSSGCAFRRARSTLDTPMQVTSAVRRRKDGEKTAAVFIDYARAFDSVDHGCIVKALLSFGVEKHFVVWIACFLQERTAQGRVNNTLLEDISLTCGVPQVSVLGPLLFIVTVDSLSKRLNCIPGLKHGFFADDLTFVCTSAGLSEIQQTIQQRLDCITNWSAEYHMEVSAEKTEYMLFVARETNLLSLKVGETALKEVRAPKLLGLTMQPHKG